MTLVGALALAPVATPQAHAAELYGMVVGIDDYIGTANDLDGAVNDAGDVAKSLNGLGAKEVVTLFNGDATKEHIVSEWNDLVAKTKPGDTIIFSYAGHGGQERDLKGATTKPTAWTKAFCSELSPRSGRYQRAHSRRRSVSVDEGGRRQEGEGDLRRRFLSLGGIERSASATEVKFRKGRFAAIANDEPPFPPENLPR